jgi:hypothetical protein
MKIIKDQVNIKIFILKPHPFLPGVSIFNLQLRGDLRGLNLIC